MSGLQKFHGRGLVEWPVWGISHVVIKWKKTWLSGRTTGRGIRAINSAPVFQNLCIHNKGHIISPYNLPCLRLLLESLRQQAWEG